MSAIEHKIERKQTTRIEFKKKKAISNDQKLKDQKTENQHKNPIKTFEKLLITEKDSLNKSQKNFMEPNKIKIGER